MLTFSGWNRCVAITLLLLKFSFDKANESKLTFRFDTNWRKKDTLFLSHSFLCLCRRIYYFLWNWKKDYKGWSFYVIYFLSHEVILNFLVLNYDREVTHGFWTLLNNHLDSSLLITVLMYGLGMYVAHVGAMDTSVFLRQNGYQCNWCLNDFLQEKLPVYWFLFFGANSLKHVRFVKHSDIGLHLYWLTGFLGVELARTRWIWLEVHD